MGEEICNFTQKCSLIPLYRKQRAFLVFDPRESRENPSSGPSLHAALRRLIPGLPQEPNEVGPVGKGRSALTDGGYPLAGTGHLQGTSDVVAGEGFEPPTSGL